MNDVVRLLTHDEFSTLVTEGHISLLTIARVLITDIPSEKLTVGSVVVFEKNEWFDTGVRIQNETEEEACSFCAAPLTEDEQYACNMCRTNGSF